MMSLANAASYRLQRAVCIIIIASKSSFLVCSMHGFSIYITSRMQASGERSPALHRRPRTRSKLLTPGIAHTFNSGGISHWADI